MTTAVQDCKKIQKARFLVQNRELQAILRCSYIGAILMGVMVNEATEVLQYIIFYATASCAFFAAIVYNYRRVVIEKQWLALTLVEFFLLLCLFFVFIIGSLEQGKIIEKSSKIILLPLLALVVGGAFWVYLVIKEKIA